MCNSAPLESRGQSSTFAVEFAVAHGLVEVVYRCLLRHSLCRLEKHFKPIGKPSGKLWGYVTGIVLEPGTPFIRCPGSRCLKCRSAFHYNTPRLVQYQGTFFPRSPPAAASKKRKKGFSGDTREPPAEGAALCPPACTRYARDRFYCC